MCFIIQPDFESRRSSASTLSRRPSGSSPQRLKSSRRILNRQRLKTTSFEISSSAKVTFSTSELLAAPCRGNEADKIFYILLSCLSPLTLKSVSPTFPRQITAALQEGSRAARRVLRAWVQSDSPTPNGISGIECILHCSSQVNGRRYGISLQCIERTVRVYITRWLGPVCSRSCPDPYFWQYIEGLARYFSLPRSSLSLEYKARRKPDLPL